MNITFYPQMKIFETKELLLRPIVIEDAKDLFEYYKEDEVVKYLPIKRHDSLSDTENFINTYFINNYKKGKIGHYAIVYKKKNKVIGNVGFNNISPKSRTGELGICINPSYWGYDLSTQLINLMIDYGFSKLKLDSIVGVIFSNNKYSKPCLQKLNFKYSNTYTRNFTTLNNKSIKCEKYILLREEYIKWKNIQKY